MKRISQLKKQTHPLTLKLIKSKNPCETGWKKLLKSLNKTRVSNTIVTISHLLESNGVEDTIWVIFNCLDNTFLKQKLDLLYDIGMQSIKYYTTVYPNEKTLENSLKIACDINSTNEEREAAYYAADAAAASNAAAAAYAAADAARAAYYAADAAAASNAAAAAYAAAYADAAAAYAARVAHAAHAAIQVQKELILKHFGNL